MDTTGINTFLDSFTKLQRIAVITAALVSLVAIYLLMDTWRGDEGRIATEDRYWAETTCKDAVDQQLKAPATAEHQVDSARELGDGKWTVSGTVDAENTFGGLMRHTWTCDADLLPNGDWRATATVN